MVSSRAWVGTIAATATTAYTLSVSVADTYTTSAVENLTVNVVQPFAGWAAAAGLGISLGTTLGQGMGGIAEAADEMAAAHITPLR